MIELTNEQKEAIETIKNTWKKKWKENLRTSWRTGQYNNIDNDTAAELQALRNKIGNKGLEVIE
ncbi:hypothetical protein [Thiolapillus sp.]|uniref:hypothetical protein n=1 Tax=Thiolapillus sp. TaxID=2017437 RepID=UPI003AF8B676